MCSLHRRNPRRDTSEKPIVDALRALGFSVQSLSGKDTPDLLVGKHGLTRVIEVKTDTDKLSENQQAWWKGWRGNALLVLRHVDDTIPLAALWSYDSRLLAEVRRVQEQRIADGKQTTKNSARSHGRTTLAIQQHAATDTKG